MEEGHPTAQPLAPIAAAPQLSRRERGITLVVLLAGAAILVIVAAVVAGAVFRPGRVVTGYSIEIAPGLAPRMNPAAAVGSAVQYLDAQAPQLAAPELHAEPRIVRVFAVRAADVRTVEPAVSAASAAADPTRIVWVVFGSGDFLNLRDHEWSGAGEPDYAGTIVIDDSSGTVLGVFPHEVPGIARPTPRPSLAVVDQP